jgi:hypothetical protein
MSSSQTEFLGPGGPGLPEEEESVVPAECALAIGIPLTRAAFLEALAQPERWDLAASEGRQFPGFTPEFLWSEFAPIARGVSGVCDVAEQLGVLVRRSATLNEFGELLCVRPDQRKVVTLVSHWRLMGLPATDVLRADAVRDAVLDRNLTHPIHRALREELSRRLGPARNPASLTAEELLSELNRLVEEAEDAHDPRHRAAPRLSTWSRLWNWLSGQVAGVGANREPRPLTRAALERAFGESVIRPGKVIEFRDGLHTVPEVIAVIPGDYRGTLDMSCCNSVLIGQAIKDHAPGCTVVRSRFPIYYSTWGLIYPVVLRVLERQRQLGKPLSYAEAVARVRLQVLSMR